MEPEGSLPCSQEPAVTNSMWHSSTSEANSRLATQQRAALHEIWSFITVFTRASPDA
jgi:hypothetical protein